MLRVETSGKSVEEAVAKALQQLGLDRSQVDVEVVNEGRGGILGVGAQQARVIVTPRPGVMATGGRPAARSTADDLDDEELEDGYEDDEEIEEDEEYDEEDEYEDDEEYDEDEDEDQEREQVAPARGGAPSAVAARPGATRDRRGPRPPADQGDPVAVAVEILQEMLDRLGIDAEITPRPPQTVGDGTVSAILDIEGDDLGLLIGRRGETLASLQYLVNLLLNRRLKAHATVGIDIEGYRRRREDSLRSLARRMAERVKSSGQSITLEPMPPNERRIVHITLADHPDVLTVSIGEGEARKVAITPRR